MPKPLHPALGRLKNARVLFHGSYRNDERERFSGMVRAQGGTVLAKLDKNTTHLVLKDLSSGTSVQKQADSLRKKGATIEVVDREAFRAFVNPTWQVIVALLKDGRRGAKALAVLAPGDGAGHGAPGGSPRVVAAKLDGLDLSNLDLSGIAFEKCSFVGANLDKTCFAETIECDFSKATGDSPKFGQVDRSKFIRVWFSNAGINSHLNGCDFTDAELENSQFSEHFWGSRVDKTAGGPPSFRRVRLPGCIFDEIWVEAADFRAADLTGAAFKGGHLDGSDFRGAKAPDLQLVAAYLRKADFTNASLVGSNLAEADMTGAKFQGADLTDVNLRGVKVSAGALKKVKGATESAPITAGPALIELDAILRKSNQVHISFRVARHPDDEGCELQITAYSTFSSLYLPDLNARIAPKPLGTVPFSEEILQAGRVFGHLPVRFETLTVKSTKAPKSGKALRDLVIKGIAEAFGQPAPDEYDETGAAAFREKQRQIAVAERERREKAEAKAAKDRENAKKRVAKTIEKAVGKVSDTASFLKALEVRIEKPKIDKATAMLKASGFKLFNDVTDEYVSGVVKSQTDPNLVYACRLAQDGQHACCTQNLNICGGLRGSICKHMLVLIIGLVQAGEFDPTTIDGWIAKTHGVKAAVNKDVMSELFIKYKGAEAGEVDWRPTETIPEDFYAM